jgi:hypothetical protein
MDAARNIFHRLDAAVKRDSDELNNNDSNSVSLELTLVDQQNDVEELQAQLKREFECNFARLYIPYEVMNFECLGQKL